MKSSASEPGLSETHRIMTKQTQESFCCQYFSSSNVNLNFKYKFFKKSKINFFFRLRKSGIFTKVQSKTKNSKVYVSIILEMKLFPPSFRYFFLFFFLSYLGNLGMIEVCQHFLIYFLIHRALEDS